MDAYYDRLNNKLDQLQQQQPKHKIHPNHNNQHFYPRIKNLTNIRFNEEQLQLLKHGLNYSIEKPTATYLTKFIDRKRTSYKAPRREIAEHISLPRNQQTEADHQFNQPKCYTDSSSNLHTSRPPT
jgi:hypothetical protein